MVASDEGFYFYTRNGNKYLYNDIPGAVMLANSEQGQNKSGQSSVSGKLDALNMPVEIDDIERLLQVEGYKSCILIVTEECNLRCKYCAYSGDYLNHRPHRDRYMPQDVAERAIMKYFEGFGSVKMSNPYMVPAIGFYGGEPLLKFDLIKNAVAFARKLYSRKIIFNLTTNGTIMSDEMLDFFIENSFLLAFSLNGPRKEHDRLRVYSDGAGSFDHVMKTLAKIRQKDIEYYRKNCSTIVIYDTGTDLMAVNEFFTKYEDELPAIARVNSVQATYTDWYSRYSKEQHSRHSKSLQQCKDLYFSQLLSKTKPPKFLEMLVGGPYRLLLMRPQNISHRPDILQFTGTCVPGMKIAVDPSGRFHCCEKVNDKFPVGDVDMGIDLHKIRKLIQNYRDNIYSGCSSCPIARNCPTCFSFFCGDGVFGISPAGYCDLVRDVVRTRYEELWSLLEAGIPEDAFFTIRPASLRTFKKEEPGLNKYFFMNRDFILKHGSHGYVIHDFSNSGTLRLNDTAGAILAKAEAGVHISDIADQLSIDEQSVHRRLDGFAERGVGRFYPSRVYIEKYKKGMPSAKYQFFRSPPVISRCFIELPGKCQLHCGYCQHHALFPCNMCFLSDDRPDIWMLKRALRRILKMNCISLIFHGGDPLASLDQFVSIVEFCRSEGFTGSINVLTNGSAIDDTSAGLLHKFNINPIVPAFLDQQTSAGFRFKVDMDRLASVCRRHEVPFTLVAVSQAGKTDINRLKNEIKQFGSASVLDAVVFDDETCLNSNILPDNILDMLLPLTADYYYHSLSHHPCLSGSLAISADGEIRPCPHIDGKDLGNIISEDALDIIFEERLIDKYWELGLYSIEKCRQCELQNRCFDCRAFEIKVTGNVLGKKYCTLKQSCLEEIKID